jgi:hypothetical protein
MMRNGAAPHIDFSDLEGMIESNPKLMPSNVDFILERRGKFLFGEFKKPDEEMSLGQNILLQALSRKPGFKVFIAVGWNEGTSLVIQQLTTIQNGVWETRACDLEGFKDAIRKWYAAVEAA